MFIKEKVKWFTMGVLITFLLTSTVLAIPIQKTISIVYDDVKIFVDGVNKTPTTEDMKPFSYNGRNYVSLRYVSEALGKSVSWDAKTKTVYIGNNPTSVKEISDDFSKPISEKWDISKKYGDWTITPDGKLKINHIGALPLITDKLNTPLNNYSIEFDMMPLNAAADFGILLNYDEENTKGNFGYSKQYVMENTDYILFNPFYVNISGEAYHFEHYYQSSNEHIKMSLTIKGDNVDVSINGQYVTSGKLKHKFNRIALVSVGLGFSSITPQCSFDNFKLKVIE